MKKLSTFLLATLFTLSGCLALNAGAKLSKAQIAKLQGEAHPFSAVSIQGNERPGFAKRSYQAPAPNNDPVASISGALGWGFLESPDGLDWIYSQTFTASTTNPYYYGSSTISLYDESYNKISDIVVEVPEGTLVNQIQPFGKVTKSFFDTDKNTCEIMVFVHRIKSAGVATSDIWVYNSNGEKVREFNDCYSATLFSEGLDWEKKERLSVVSENDADGNKTISVYRKKTYYDDTTEPIVLDHTFTFEGATINYSDGMCFYTTRLNNKFYYIISHYDKPFVASIDYTTGGMTYTENNSYISQVYDESYNLLTTISIPVVIEGAMPTMYTFGLFSDNDLSLGYYTGDDQVNVVITRYDYDMSNDSYTYGFDVYNQAGEKVKTINEGVSNWLPMSPVAGLEDQFAFLKNINATEQAFEMIDVPSCTVAQIIPSTLDGKVISTSIDRVKAGDSYKYVIGMGQAESDEAGNVIAVIGWYNKDLTLDRYVRFNLGTRGELFTPYVSASYLNPYLFDTDDEYEYIFIEKIKREGSDEIDNILCIGNEDGTILKEFAGDDTNVYYNGGILNEKSADTSLFIVLRNEVTDEFKMDFYSLPFAKFAGGEGTEANPYLVSTVGDLKQIAKEPGAYYTMINDIDMAGVTDWTPIPLTGHFDGGNHVISNFTVENSDNEVASLFGEVIGEVVSTGNYNRASIKNLAFTDPVIVGNDVCTTVSVVAAYLQTAEIDNVQVYNAKISNASNYSTSIGIIANSALLYSSITNCLVSKVVLDAPKASSVGGIVGDLGSGSQVLRCAVVALEGNVRGTVGGIVGNLSATNGDALVSDCRTSVVLTGENNIGGIVGTNGRSKVVNCYSQGKLTATMPEYGDYNDPLYSIGGIIGSVATDWNASAASPKVVENCIAAIDEINVVDEDNTASLFKGIHRIVGTCVEDFMDGMTEYGVNACYANTNMKITLNGNESAVSVDDATKTDGANVSSCFDDTFLTGLNYKFGTDDENPWYSFNYALISPVLYFERDVFALLIDKEKIVLDAIGDQDVITAKLLSGIYDVEALEVSSSNDNVVVVGMEPWDSNGYFIFPLRVTAVGNGVATITIKYQDKVATCEVFSGDAGVTVIDAQNANIIYRGGVVSAEGAKKIDLFNISGALVCGANADQLSVSNIEKGIYVVVVTDNNGRRTAKKIAIR